MRGPWNWLVPVLRRQAQVRPLVQVLVLQPALAPVLPLPAPLRQALVRRQQALLLRRRRTLRGSVRAILP